MLEAFVRLIQRMDHWFAHSFLVIIVGYPFLALAATFEDVELLRVPDGYTYAGPLMIAILLLGSVHLSYEIGRRRGDEPLQAIQHDNVRDNLREVVRSTYQSIPWLLRMAARAALLVPLTGVGYLVGMLIGTLLVVAGLRTGTFPSEYGNAVVMILLLFGGFGIAAVWWAYAKLWTRPPSGEAFSLGDFLIGAGTRIKSLSGGLFALIVGAVVLTLLTTRVPLDLFGPNAWQWLRWGFIIGYGLLILFLGGVIVTGIGAIGRAFVAGPKLQDDTHGKARTATESELRQAGLIPRRDAIYLGRFLNGGQVRDELGYPSKVHLITIGPTGSGKGSGLIIPNLSELRRSILIIDPKGEAAAVTARKRAQFGRVVILNPFNILTEERPWMKSNGFNPLATLDKTLSRFVDDATGIAEALVRIEGKEPHWPASAQDLVAGLIMHEVMKNGPAANLGNVRTMLTEPLAIKDGKAIGLAATLAEMQASAYQPLRAKIGKFLSPTAEIHNILSTAGTQTKFLDSPPIIDDLASSNVFRFANMKNELVTVYLILPADELEKHSNWLRLMIASALRELLATPPSTKLPPVLFILDEFAQLGHLPAISNAMNIARSFGVQLWPIVQDFNQLHTIYGDNWENFVGASAALTSFRVRRDLFTAQYLSNLCGTKTVIVESENERTGSNSAGRGRGPQGLPLFRPEELMALPERQMLCFIDPVDHPFMAHAPAYQEGDGLDPNPYHSGS
jgi:type IV secretion system protein VirD4